MKNILITFLLCLICFLASCSMQPNSSIPSTDQDEDSSIEEPAQEKTYSVTFATNLPDSYIEDNLVLTGYIEEIKIESGKTITKPTPVLSYQGVEITFDEWKTSDGEYYDFSQPIKNNIQLYGTWKTTEKDGTWYIFDVEGLLAWNEATMTDLTASMVLFSDLQFDNTNAGNWIPVGNGGSYYGTIEGKNHTISGISVISENQYLGFVGVLNGGSISNLILDNISIISIAGGEHEGPFDFADIGSFAGWFVSGLISDCKANGIISKELEAGSTGGVVGINSDLATINNSSFSGKVITHSSAGGIAGENRGKIVNSSSDVTISTTYGAGGIVSSNYGEITACSSEGSIGTSETAFSGGISANNYGTIMFCNSSASVYGNNPVGGIAGNSDNIVIGSSFSGNILSEYGEVGGIVARNNGDVIASYSTADIRSKGNYSNYIGGITGTNSGNVYACYSTSNITGSGQIGGITGSNSGSAAYCLWQNETSGIKSNAGTSTSVTVVSSDWETEYPALNIGIGIWNSRNPNKQCDCIYSIDSTSSLPIISI